MQFFKLFFICFLFFIIHAAHAQTIHIVAAENMYGDIAQTLGGKAVEVQSILQDPNTDPHLFNADPHTISYLQKADIIIINGAGYDAWIEPLLKNTHAQILNVAEINHLPHGVNPHLWYNLSYVKNFAQALALTLEKSNPNNKDFDQNAKVFNTQLAQLQSQLNQLRAKYLNQPVTATEPVAGYLLQALGLTILDQHFQLSVMNDTEPSAQDYAKILENIKTHHIRLLIFNEQVSDPLTTSLRKTAIESHTPVVGMSELMPLHQHYLSWYESNVQKIKDAL